jgi:hypothetical protein
MLLTVFESSESVTKVIRKTVRYLFKNIIGKLK